MDEFIGEFIIETQEGLTALDTALVTFSDNPNDKSLLDTIFRTLHTIKGTCGFLGLTRLEKLAHISETLLDGFRKDVRTATPDDVDLILKGLDQIRLLVDAIAATGKEPEGDDTTLIASIQAAINGEAAQTPYAPAPGIQDGVADEEIIAPAENLTAPAPPEKSVVPQSAPAAPVQDQSSQFLRIHVDRLEEMLAMVSELVLTRNQLTQVTRSLNEESLEEPIQRLNSVVSELQDSVMKARMQPIGNAWAKFPRIIHDIARETGKSIQLVMIGEDTEVDRQVLEYIKDPLMHMIRNSADHGIEMPDERRAAGKSESGKIILSACHERGYVVIEIRDDGKGIAVDRVKQTAIKRGIATEEQLALQSDRHILSYIFAPGFSTAEKVTAISGRGVGMDVVRTNIEKIGGTIDLESTQGKGSRFIIRIPLTLAIIPALLITAGKNLFAIPQLGTQELIHINHETSDKIETVGGVPVLRLRENLLPLVNLDSLLNDRGGHDVPESCYIIVSNAGSSYFGIIIDNVLETEEVVVKPLPASLRNLTAFAGNTILGDGRVVMILDPAGIAAQSRVASHIITNDVQTSQSTLDADNQTSLLIFNAEDTTPKAVPAFLVTRIAEFEESDLERSGEKIMVQYQGRLIELHPLGKTIDGETVKALIFADEGEDHIFGIIIERINDIVTTSLKIEESARRPGYLGSAIVEGRATDILDISHYTGNESWLPTHIVKTRDVHRRNILLVDDSVFFRHMLQPLLQIAGYDVTVVPGPISALSLCDRGVDFDLIVSDIEMEEMDGLAFAEKVKSETRWKNIPMVALSSHSSIEDKEIAYKKGFSAYVSKSDRDALLSTLRQVFEEHESGVLA
jgi:two-component system chemotaxis sensor kinase CheA